MRSRIGGWSKDCIWISSSFTMPPVPEEIMEDTERARFSGAGEASRESRDAPMASISSMKPIAPPCFRAIFLRDLKKDLILKAVIPNQCDCKEGAAMNRNGTPACLAIALARYVF